MSKVVAAVVAILPLMVGRVALAAPITISSTVTQSGLTEVLASPSPSSVQIPSLAYDFSGTPYSSLISITNVSITLTLFDAGTGPSDPYVNLVRLTLDNIGTGLLLNGFFNDQTVTQTISGPISGTPPGAPSNESLILAALLADGKLVGAVRQTDFLGPGNVNRIGVPSAFSTTLQITGEAVPEPAALLLFATGLAGIAVARWRKFAGCGD